MVEKPSIRNHGGRCRAGFSLLELQIALVILAIGMAGLTPTVVMYLRQVRSLDRRFDSAKTHYLVPPANSWAAKLGAATAIQLANPPARTAFSNLYINFQPVPPDNPGSFEGHAYKADRGALYANRGNGFTYGWDLDLTAATRNRDVKKSKDERYDTLIHTQLYGNGKWEVAVPEGVYTARVVAGDASYTDSSYKIAVEGMLAVSGVPTTAKPWVEGSASVLVIDGRLTISNAPTANNNKICFVDIVEGNPTRDVRINSVEKSLTSEQVTAHVAIKKS